MIEFQKLPGRRTWRFQRGGALLLSSFFFTTYAGYAQDHSSQDRFELDPLLVTASSAPKKASDYTTLASALDTETLASTPAGNLGQLLETQLGVQNSGFASGAGRPVIRGFSGDRVQILEDGMRVFDVSATSDDHAVGSEPFLASSIEVLRGPSTLLYGGNAIGGVVNVITEAAPTGPLASPSQGRVLARYDDGTDGWTSGGIVAAGTSQWAIRAGALVQREEDYRLPDGFEPDDHDEQEDEHDGHDDEEIHASVLENSFSDRDTFQLGGSWFLKNGGRISAYGTQLDALYGVPGHAHAEEVHDDEEQDEEEEANVRVDLRSRCAGVALDVPLQGSIFKRATLDLAHTDYAHRELEGDEIGTVFTRKSWELRSEWTHRMLAGNEGVLGTQLLTTDFEAQGEEAFTPPSITRQAALFWLGERPGEVVSLQHGVRLEWQESRPDHFASPSYEGLAASAASGLRWKFNRHDALGAQLSLSQRHPSETELFADGPHLASGRFEIGDPHLNVETAIGLDLTYRTQHEPIALMLAGFLYRFDDYIYEAPTGSEREDLPVYQFRQEDAIVAGMEAELTVHLMDRDAERLHLVLSGDWAHLEAIEADEALPRNPPARARAGLHYERGIASARIGVSRVFAQDHLAPFETVTNAYTMFDLRLAVECDLNGRTALLFLEANNLGDELAFNHLSYLKEAKPLPGRRVSLGVLMRF